MRTVLRVQNSNTADSLNTHHSQSMLWVYFQPAVNRTPRKEQQID